MNISEAILSVYPKAMDCVNGHLGPEVQSIEQFQEDDRYYDHVVTRCGHCNMVLKSEYSDDNDDVVMNSIVLANSISDQRIYISLSDDLFIDEQAKMIGNQIIQMWKVLNNKVGRSDAEPKSNR